MEHAIKEVIRRHEALRSTFSEDGRQICVHRELPLRLRVEDLSAHSPQDQDLLIAEFTRKNALDVFDLVNGPLFRTDLFKLSEEEYYFTITAHHIICDGWSLGIILQDLGKFYAAFANNREPHFIPAPAFSEYAAGQKQFADTDEYKKIEQYWTAQFQHSVPVLDLPTDFPRPQERTYKSHRLDFPLEPELVSAIKKTGIKSGSTLVTILMAAFEVFLNRLTGQSEIILGIPAAGQASNGLYGLVGHCVNLLPVRSYPEGESFFCRIFETEKITGTGGL